jgi:serine/threonine protein phosphatase PrpC
MREDAENSPYRNILLQAMGQAPEITVAIGRLHLRNGDRIVVCSDGLTNEVTRAEIHRYVTGSGSLADACDRLVALANERGGHDNITVVVAVISGESLARFADSEEQGRATLSQLSEFKPGQ